MQEANSTLTGYDKMKINRISFDKTFKVLRSLARERKIQRIKKGSFEEYAIINN